MRRALRANDHARVLVTGCAAAIDAAFYEALDERVSVVGKAQLAQAIDALFDDGALFSRRGPRPSISDPASARAWA